MYHEGERRKWAQRGARELISQNYKYGLKLIRRAIVIHYFARAATTKYPRPSGFSNRNVLPRSSACLGTEAKVKMLQDSLPLRPAPWLPEAAFWCLQMTFPLGEIEPSSPFMWAPVRLS